MPTTRPANPLRRIADSFRDIQQRHLDRHRPTGFGFAFADRIGYLDAEKWDAVTECQSVFFRRDLLRVIEQNGPDNIHPRYAIIFRNEKPIVALAMQLVSVTKEQFNAKRPKERANLLRHAIVPATKIVTSNLREQLLVAGNLLSWGFHGIAFARGEEPCELWPAVAEALYRVRRAERLIGNTNFVMIKDLSEAQTGLEALRRFSYRPMETEPNMVLELSPRWCTYDDYLAALDAKYRRNAKDQVKKLTAASCVVEPLRDLSTHAQRLHELYLSVHDNASVRLVTLPASYLPALAQMAGDNFRCTVVRRGDNILGFVTTLRDGDTAIGYYIGFDRAAAAEGLPIYLRLLHVTIADAIHWRCKRVSLGRTALEPKAALGAKPETTTVWIRHRVPSFNWILRGLLGAVPHAEAPERNPFKFVEAEAENPSR